MSFPIQPENGKLIIKTIARKDQKIGSVVVPGVTNAALEVGEVLAAAKDTGIKTSDLVTYPAKRGVGQLIGGEPCLWLEQTDIWGVWSKKEWEKENAGDE